jgi:hypothetical protein
MSLLHKESYECVVSDLDLTASPPTQTSVEENAGMIARRIKDSKPFEPYGRLHTDISFQNRIIINNVDMVLRLIRNQSSFCLMGDGVHNYELFIDEASLYMRQVKVVLRLRYDMQWL